MVIKEPAKKPGFSDFGHSFQNTLAKAIVLDKNFCAQIQEVIEIGYFELKHHQVFVKKIFEYRDKYNKHPSVETLKTIVKTDLKDVPEVLRKKIQEFTYKSFSKDSKVEDASFVKDKSLDFCKKQKLYLAMEKSIELLEKASFDEISQLINDALKLGNSNLFGYDYKKDFEDRFIIQQRNPVTTGWTLIDAITKGGLGRGELGVVIAPTGCGKSHVLVHLGTKAMLAGKSVVHYTLELTDTHVANRYDACVAEVSLNDLFACKDAIYETVKDVKGELLVKEYPTKSASTRTIRNHLDRLKQQGRNIDVIIVDYGDLLRPITNYKEKRDNLGSIYEELRAIAQEYECPIWTASQTNRTGINAEVITMESISEAFNKCFVADFIFSLSRTTDDKNTNRGRVYIAKNRAGPDGIVFPIFMDTSRVKIDILKSAELNAEESSPFVKGMTSQQRLKEKYRETLKKKGNK